MNALVLEAVSYAIGQRRIIDSISASMAAGQRSVILGANGAGKSILLRLCHGLLTPTSGRIHWRGETVASVGQAMVFQRPVMLRRSAIANIMHALALQGVKAGERRERAIAALRKVHLGHIEARAARVLSGGEQQRLALARAWALRPQVLLLDEPTANLDPVAARAVETIIQDIHEAGTKIIMTTHNLAQARRLGDMILFIADGRLIEHATADAFFASPATAVAADFIRGELP
jgi:tungstate transport system ATP-binding protein